MCYVNWSKQKKLVGWVGDPLDQVQVAMYADADFSGCVDSLRSTSGCQVNLRGKHTCFPLVGNSQRESTFTQAFADPIRWKHACMLVNIFDQGDLDDPQRWKR